MTKYMITIVMKKITCKIDSINISYLNTFHDQVWNKYRYETKLLVKLDLR